jgi:hypothetical protein
MAALNRRAQRFQREHELERHKTISGNGNGSTYGSQTSLGANHHIAHVFNSRTTMRVDSPSLFGNPDDPEADPVSRLTLCYDVD